MRDELEVPMVDGVRARRPWETPAVEELAVKQSAAQPGGGLDGGDTFPDCTHS